MDIFAKLIFPVFGLLMIAFAVGAFFFPYGSKIKDVTQKIEAFGIRLEISVITAIILGGMIFCGIGFYINEYSYQKKYDKVLTTINNKVDSINKLIEQKHELAYALSLFKTQSISYRFTLSDVDENNAPPPAGHLTCIYYKSWDKSDSISYKVYPAESKSYRVTFDNLSAQQLMELSPVVYLVNSKTKKRWVAQSFNPLAPYLSLTPDE